MRTDLPDKTCTNCKKLLPAKNFRFQENSCYDCEKTRLYKWRENNPEKFKEICRKQRDKVNYRDKQNEYKRDKYNSDDNQRLTQKYRHLIREIIKDNRKNLEPIENLIDVDISFFKKWLEYNFTEDMSWDNYGSYWQIDHTIPCNSFDLIKDEELKKCFNWSNMVPIKSEDNLKKFNKIDDERIEYFENRAEQFLNNSNT